MTRLHIKHLEQCLFHQKHTTDMSSLWVISRPPQCWHWPNLYSSLSYKHQNRIFKNLLCIPRGCSNSSSVSCLIVNFFFPAPMPVLPRSDPDILVLDLVRGKFIRASLKVTRAPFLTSGHIYISTQLPGPPVSPLGCLWNLRCSVPCCSSGSVSFWTVAVTFQPIPAPHTSPLQFILPRTVSICANHTSLHFILSQ